MNIDEKYEKLKRIIKRMDEVVVAYSGGVDSTFLLKVAKDILGSKVIAVLATSPTYPSREFDEAVKVGIQRKEFYESPDVVLVVYSVADRWSFESLTYWLKEIAVTNEVLPPIVVVGNKADLRTDTTDDSGEPPISEKEGFDYAEELATTLARDGKIHPVAFIETSCTT